MEYDYNLISVVDHFIKFWRRREETNHISRLWFSRKGKRDGFPLPSCLRCSPQGVVNKRIFDYDSNYFSFFSVLEEVQAHSLLDFLSTPGRIPRPTLQTI
jgi:hypothetical protein